MSADRLPRRRCRGQTCTATIVLVPTVGGVRIPIDVAAHPNGNVYLSVDLLGEPIAHVLNAKAAAEVRATGERLFMPHHATCPDVESFR